MQAVHAHPFHRASALLVLRSQPRHRPRTRLKLAHAHGISHARAFTTSLRGCATHRDTPPSALLSQTLDQRQRSARNSQADTAGPFTLGMTRQPLGAAQNVKKWSELSTKGKVMRTTARTTNLTVIVLGAGITAMLAYALASELFAKNSPTVLYGDACKLIEESDKISEHLPGPLTFHNNPPSSSRPRHRNRHVSSQLARDSAGREHLLLNFYIRSSPGSSSSLFEEDGYLGRVQNTIRALGEEWTWDDARTWGSEALQGARESARRVFLYLTGEAGSSSSSASFPFSSTSQSDAHDAAPSPYGRRETHIGQHAGDEEGGLWASVAGLFSGIGKSIGAAAGSGAAGRGRKEGRGEIFEEGEVHCDLVKDDNGNFIWRYIIVDMPNSHARYPHRVFVKRAVDIRDNEAVMRWT
ncbi:TIM21-domain-containing protein [Phellopilus nigrolimitatus]|nr:TIM21-domain-containing protein [Phellopilus nigrolimitatus]